MWKCTFVVFCALVAVAWGYSAGAPVSACDDMTPNHPGTAKKSGLTRTVSVGKKEVSPGETIDITVSGKSFKGYFLQIRNGDKAVGSFEIPDTDRYSKAIDCHGGKGSAATHKNSVGKDNIVLKWKAPEASGEYQAYVTIVEVADTYWAGIPTQKIKVI